MRLRYRLAAATADAYCDAGFTTVVQDVILGEELTAVIRAVHSRPLLVVVLAPAPDVVAARERGRGKDAYHMWTIPELDAALWTGTPRWGLWLDTSRQTPDETVAEILRRAPAEAPVPGREELVTPGDLAAPGPDQSGGEDERERFGSPGIFG